MAEETEIFYIPDYRGHRLMIKPEFYGLEQRVEASALATAEGVGLRMEVHSFHTEFWTDPTVPVGQVGVWTRLTYMGGIEPETMLASPEEDYMPRGQDSGPERGNSDG